VDDNFAELKRILETPANPRACGRVIRVRYMALGNARLKA
jgi:hypothetical protein